MIIHELKMQLKSSLNKVFGDKKDIGLSLLMISLISSIFRSQISILNYLSVFTLILGIIINIRVALVIRNYLNRKLFIWSLVIIFCAVPLLYEVFIFKNLYSELFGLVYILGLSVGLYSYFIIDYKKYSLLFFINFKRVFIFFGPRL